MLYRLYAYALTFLLLLTFNPADAQSCDTCTTAWGPEQFVEYTGLTHYTHGGCTYNVIVIYKLRMCNGQIQISIDDTYLSWIDPDPRCQLQCWDAGWLYRFAVKQLVLDIGQPVTFLSPAACYAAVEVDPPTTLAWCFGAEWSTIPRWMVVLPCDSTGCCKTTMIPNPDGTVTETTVESVACPPGTAPTIPPAVEIRCFNNGVEYSEWVPVIPGQNPTCETTCNGTGYTTTYKRAKSITRHNSNLLAFPNPAQDLLTVSYQLKNQATVGRLILVDMNGKTVLEQKVSGAEGKVEMKVGDLPRGSYICNFISTEQVLTSNTILLVD